MTKQDMDEVFAVSFDNAEAFEVFRCNNVHRQTVARFFGPDMGREYESAVQFAENAA